MLLLSYVCLVGRLQVSDTIVFNQYVEWLKKNKVSRVELGCAAHAAATARYNNPELGDPSAVMPDTVVEVTE